MDSENIKEGEKMDTIKTRNQRTWDVKTNRIEVGTMDTFRILDDY